jgi:hypothetical protein
MKKSTTKHNNALLYAKTGHIQGIRHMMKKGVK